MYYILVGPLVSWHCERTEPHSLISLLLHFQFLPVLMRILLFFIDETSISESLISKWNRSPYLNIFWNSDKSELTGWAIRSPSAWSDVEAFCSVPSGKEWRGRPGLCLWFVTGTHPQMSFIERRAPKAIWKSNNHRDTAGPALGPTSQSPNPLRMWPYLKTASLQMKSVKLEWGHPGIVRPMSLGIFFHCRPRILLFFFFCPWLLWIFSPHFIPLLAIAKLFLLKQICFDYFSLFIFTHCIPFHSFTTWCPFKNCK